MGYNPFESFRKNSKTIIAVMAIICMFTFVLSSGVGGGDFFDWLARQFGGGRRTPEKEEIGVYFGKPITEAEMRKVRQGRMAADLFMLSAVGKSSNVAFRQLELDIQNKKKLSDPETSKTLTDFFRAEKQLQSFTKDTTAAEREAVQNQFGQSITTIKTLQSKLDEKTQPEELKAVNKLMSILRNKAKVEEAQQNGRLYFATTDTRTDLGYLQFIMLLRKADQMGFKYTDDQITGLINMETDNALSEKDAAAIEADIRRGLPNNRGGGGISSAELHEAIGNEFRARTMAASLRGDRAGPEDELTAQPIALTPWDAFKFYRDNCSESKFRMIEIPVDAFLADVKEEPTPKDLEKIFKGNSHTEARPDSDKLGFRQPNRAMFEYIAIDTKSPFYEKVNPLTQAVSAIAAGATPTMLGGGIAATVMHVDQPTIAANLPLEESIQRKIKDVQNSGFPDARFSPITRFRDNVVFHPLPFAALAPAGFAGNLSSLTGALANQYNFMYILDTQDRVKTELPAVLAGAGFGGLPTTIAPLYPLNALAPAAVGMQAKWPTGVYRQEIVERERKDKLEKIIRQDREDFEKKLKELGAKIVYPKKTVTAEDQEKQKKADEAKAEVQKFIDDFAKARGFKVYRGQKLDDRWDVRADPGMKPLIDAANEARRTYLKDLNKEVPGFEQEIATAEGLRKVSEERMNLPTGYDEVEKLFEGPSEFDKTEAKLYQPIRFPQYDDFSISSTVERINPKHYLVWRIEDVPTKDYGTVEQMPKDMKDRVILAWKTQKARELAQKQADALAADLRSWAPAELQKGENSEFATSPFSKRLLDLLAQTQGTQHKTYRAFTLSGIAKLKRERSVPNNSRAFFGSDGPAFYGPPTIPSTEIRYPGDKMIPALLDARNQPLGDTIILSDAPKSHFYVACLIQKTEKEALEFISSVYLRSSMPDDVKSKVMNAYFEMKQSERAGMERGRQMADLMLQFAKSRAVQALGPFDPLLFPTAYFDTEVPAFRKDFMEKLKAEGSFKANEEEMKKLQRKDKDNAEE